LSLEVIWNWNIGLIIQDKRWHYFLQNQDLNTDL
jgi:hypothetical protein